VAHVEYLLHRLLQRPQVPIDARKRLEKMAVDLPLPPQQLVVKRAKDEEIELLEGEDDDPDQTLPAWNGIVLPDVPVGAGEPQRG